MSRYFMTGCTGFMGRALVLELCRREDTEHILLLTRNPQLRYDFYGIDGRVQLYEGDINSCQFPTNDFTHIIHGANPPATANPQEVYYSVVDGTARILAWSAKRGIKNFLLLSSGAARGDPDIPYGRAKRMAELLLRCETTQAKIARVYTLIGEGIPISYAVGDFLFQAKNDGVVRVIGGEQVFRTYLHVEDAARWIMRIVDHGHPLTPYDVGGALPYSILEVAQLVAHKFRVPVKHIASTHMRGSYLPDLQEALRIGCTTTIPLGIALERIRDEISLCNPRVEPAKAT